MRITNPPAKARVVRQRRQSYMLRRGARDHLWARGPSRGPDPRHPAYAAYPAYGRGQSVLDDVGRREGLGGGAVGAGRRYEHGLSVVAQLGDRLADVRERPVAAGLLRGVEVDPWVPAPGQLLDRADVDD